MASGDVDLWEINEAFAAVPLAVEKTLGIDPDNIKIDCGAITFGQPLGATSTLLIATFLDSLNRRGLPTGLVTLCIGCGMGITTVVERV